MKQYRLQARTRGTFGKHVRALRRQGVLPAHVYGPHISPISIEVDAHAFQQVWSKAGGLTLVKLDVNGEERTVLIREVQREPTTGRLLHADLYAVAMTERLRASVPVVLVGHAPATGRGGVLLRTLDVLQVECLPGNLPHEIGVDVSGLEEFDAGIHVRDLTLPEGVAVVTSADELVVKVAAPTIEVEEVVTPVAPPPEAQAGHVESAGGEAEAEAGA